MLTISHLPFTTDTVGLFNIYQLMPVDGIPSLMSIRGTAHSLMNRSACETPGWQFIVWLGFKSRLHSSEGSVCTSRMSHHEPLGFVGQDKSADYYPSSSGYTMGSRARCVGHTKVIVHLCFSPLPTYRSKFHPKIVTVLGSLSRLKSLDD